MAFVAGDITEITYNHPQLGSGRLLPKAGEDSTFDPGGFKSADDAQMVTASGQMIDQLSNSRWSLEATIAWDMNDTEELAKLQALAASPVQADWTISHANLTVYAGKGKPVGDLQGNANAGTIALKLSGGGQLKKIA